MDEDGLKNGDKTDNRDKEGKFLEGTTPGPGRPKGLRNKFSISMLEEAIKAEEAEVAKQKGFGIPIFQQFVRMAYREPGVMIALMKKFVPDKQYTEIAGLEPIKFEVEILNGNKKSTSE